MRRMTADSGLDEDYLVDAWREGDADAMGLLYARYAPALRAYCCHRLGSPVDADDAVHDTFLKAQLAMQRFEPGARLWPWLASIAAHVCSDIHRKRLRNRELESMPVVPNDLDEQLATRVRAAIVGDALRTLPPRYRAPLYLKHFVGSTYDEIARLQGRSVASVRSMLMRGRRQLGQRIETVARSERQWPLPITVPLTRRLRLRQNRRGPGVLARSMQQLAVLEAGWLASAAMLAPAAGAVVVATAAVVAPANASVGARQPTSGPSLSDAPAAPMPVDLPTVEVRHTQPRSNMTTDQVGVPGEPPVEGSAGIEQTQYSLVVTADAAADIPVYGTTKAGFYQNVRCYDFPIRPCDVVEPVVLAFPP